MKNTILGSIGTFLVAYATISIAAHTRIAHKAPLPDAIKGPLVTVLDARADRQNAIYEAVTN